MFLLAVHWIVSVLTQGEGLISLNGGSHEQPLEHERTSAACTYHAVGTHHGDQFGYRREVPGDV
jgi:hypothetical protein